MLTRAPSRFEPPTMPAARTRRIRRRSASERCGWCSTISTSTRRSGRRSSRSPRSCRSTTRRCASRCGGPRPTPQRLTDRVSAASTSRPHQACRDRSPMTRQTCLIGRLAGVRDGHGQARRTGGACAPGRSLRSHRAGYVSRAVLAPNGSTECRDRTTPSNRTVPRPNDHRCAVRVSADAARHHGVFRTTSHRCPGFRTRKPTVRLGLRE